MTGVSASWLSVDGVRVDEHGGFAVRDLTFRSDGPRLVVVGAPAVFGRAIAGMAPVATGAVLVGGLAPTAALAAGKVAYAPLDPRLPEAWRARAFVESSARLHGLNASAARASASAALGAFELGAMADRFIGSLPAACRRALVLAAAVATRADTLVWVDPTEGLPDADAETLSQIIARALGEASWVLLTGRLSLCSQLTDAARDVVYVCPDGVVAQGSPIEVASGARGWLLRIDGACDALADRLRATGVGARVSGDAMVVTLPDGLSTRDLFRLAADQGATLWSLAPSFELGARSERANPDNERRPVK